MGANAVPGVGVREWVVEWMQAAGSQVEGAGMRAPRGGVLLPLLPSAEDHAPFRWPHNRVSASRKFTHRVGIYVTIDYKHHFKEY